MKLLNKKFFGLLFFFLLSFVLISCTNNNNGDDNKTEPVLKSTIHFNTKMEGVSVDPLTGEIGSEVNKPTDPVKEGYTFLHWSLNGSEYTFTVFPNSTIILEAVWKEDIIETNYYTISFDTDSNIDLNDLVLEAGAEIALPNLEYKVNDLKTEAYQFDGWLYNDELIDFDIMPNHNIILTAKWQKADAIIFDTGNSNTEIAPLFGVSGKTVVAPQVQPKLDGYFFSNWEYQGIAYVFEKMPNSTITLTAKYLQLVNENVDELALPKMFIDLKDNYPLSNINRDDYKMASFTLVNPNPDFDLLAITGEFRGRGHGSWTEFNKKGYKIKFDKKQGLYDLAANKHWVIVAGGHDPSLVRHNMAYTFADEVFDYINFQTAVIELEVYINGSYHGVYALYEHIRVGEGRVDINSEFGVLDTDYLIEYDAYARDEGIAGVTSFSVTGLKYPFMVKGPKMEDWEEDFKNGTIEQVRAQVSWIKEYVQYTVNAALSGNQTQFRQYADVNSFVDMYILQELMKNTDAGWSSLYFYKEAGGKLKAGPAWDFDLSSGVNRGDTSPTGFHISGKGPGTAYQSSNHTANEIYISLMEHDWFITLVANRFIALADELRSSVNNYFDKIANFEDAYKRDSIRWTSGSNISLTKQVELKSWLHSRINWLENWFVDYIN